VGDISGATADGNEMEGYIDDIAIFNETLSSTEISELYTQGNSGYQTMPKTQVIIDFDLPQKDAPHPYTISNIHAILDNGNYNYGRRGHDSSDYAYYFDGNTNTRIEIKQVPESKEFSASVRIRPNIQKTYQTIISKGTGRYIYTDANDSTVKINHRGDLYTIQDSTQSSSWIQIGVTVNKEGIMNTYVNGELTYTYKVATENIPGDIMLGDSIDNDGNERIGEIDEIAFLSEAISEDEMRNIFDKDI
jgi:hypothetical protein